MPKNHSLSFNVYLIHFYLRKVYICDILFCFSIEQRSKYNKVKYKKKEEEGIEGEEVERKKRLDDDESFHWKSSMKIIRHVDTV